MKKILVTGASGFIGSAICRNLAVKNRVIGFDLKPSTIGEVICVKGCILNMDDIKSVLSKYKPDIVIHCAAVTHQKLKSQFCSDNYNQSNYMATKNIFQEAAKVNPQVHLIFLSSISVYGEKQIRKLVKEKDECYPISDYAVSKLKAEKSLVKLFNEFLLNRVDILRLAPVYDVSWSLNLEKRVFAPMKLFYIRFGTGCQKISVLSRSNLVDFIAHRIEGNIEDRFCNTLNISDQFPCSFNEIIEIFKQSAHHPKRRVVKVPLWLVWVITRIGGKMMKQKSGCIYSFYDKLSKNLIFDNTRMLSFGYTPVETLKSVYNKQ